MFYNSCDYNSINLISIRAFCITLTSYKLRYLEMIQTLFYSHHLGAGDFPLEVAKTSKDFSMQDKH